LPIVLHGPNELLHLRRAGRAAAATLAQVGARLAPGVSTAQIDAWVRADTKERGGTPSQLGYKGFPAAVCTSRNEVVCHGIPSEHERLEPGDIVKVDVTPCVAGYHGDTSATFFVAAPTPEARHVVEVARRCRDAGIAVVRDGARIGDIGAAILELATREGCGVVRELCGHGIGRAMHMEPQICHAARAGEGRRLRTGMVFPSNRDQPRQRQALLEDGWTVVTADRSLPLTPSTVLVTKTAPKSSVF
jgi:methionyl aminopeptidase